MGNTGRDPIDHSRTTRQRAGETMKNTRTMPGLVLGAVAIVAFVIGLFMFAASHIAAGVVAEVVAAIAAVVAVAWMLGQHRRIGRAAAAYAAEHPEARVEPPTA
ncbi:hypothetical protein H7J51_09945 [Mycobacterium crocinum]|uniref:UsfY protein n=1 Tax=Mycolicibacterium crocinum TaxID=388459 RepID=A0ABY3TUP0_9MYCO|nr:hypothetical protein [Mycolicibacterium crocinum]MCV7215604.1 hypothetical protein [Mycolicibacterium crocinum]ULN43029.1 hypothetical protein MI149_08100 [Mycolicibacterium crocinum]